MFKLLFSILISAAALIANAQSVKIIVPYAPGGPADQIARAIQINLSKRLPYNFQVEHHLGAGGLIASRYVATYRGPDTLLLVHSPAIISGSFNDDAGYNLQQDFLPVFNLGYTPMVLITNAKSPYTSIDKILKSDKPMFFGVAGQGGSLQLAGETFRRQTKKDMTAVPYKGDAAAFNDILTNSLSFTFSNVSTIQGMADSNQIVILGITGSQRSPRLPSVPTLAEQGIKGFETSPNWMSLFTTKSADPELINIVKKELAESYKDPVESQSYLKAGIDIDTKTLLNAPEFIKSETTRIQRLVPTQK